MSSQGGKGKVAPLYFDNASSSRRGKYLVSQFRKVYGKARTPQEERELLDEAARRMASFLGLSREKYHCFSFVPNATYGLNEVAYYLTPTGSMANPSRIRLPVHLSDSEHASNHLIWLKLAEKPITYLPIRNPEGWKLPEEKSIFSFACCTNLEGIWVPYELIDEKFRGSQHVCIVDGSQAMQYGAPKLENSPIDYFIFTAHKCFGPNGIGVVYSREGHEIGLNGRSHARLMPNYGFDFDALEAWVSSFDVLEELYSSGFIARETRRLNEYFLSNFPKDARFLSLLNGETKGLIFLLEVTHEDVSAHDVVFYLNVNNVTVRAGNSCSWLSGEKRDSSKLIRVSLGPFNSTSEIDGFFGLIRDLSEENLL